MRIVVLAAAFAFSACVAPPATRAPGTAPASKADRVVVTGAPAPVYFGRRLEPAAGAIIHGAGQSNPDQGEYLRVLPVDRRPMVMMTYGAGVDAEWLSQREKETGGLVIPQLGLPLVGKGDLAAIAAGDRDSDIDLLCIGLRDLDRPVFLRIGYEFNGEWNHYDAETYKKAFIRIVARLRRNHCDQVAAVWCFAVEGADSDYMKYYPGDDVVDWWAIDLFSPEHLTSGLTKKFIADAAAHKFPVMIGESGPRWVGARQGELSWRAWYGRYIRLMRENPNIKCFCLIVDDWASAYKLPAMLHDWGDGRLWLDPYVWASWLEEMGDPQYLHARSRAETLRALNAAP